MGKKIILLSDGTGNSAAKVWRTNVWRIFESLELKTSDQIAFYDDGVGTSSFKPLAVLGGVFGLGLKRNVLSLYKSVCRNYKSSADYARENTVTTDDEIFAFGFSRGAFTIRVLIGLILDQGLVKYDTEADLDRKTAKAYRAYRKAKFRPTIWRRLWHKAASIAGRKTDETQIATDVERPVDKIRFLGLWDTVSAYGLPVDEMTRGVSEYFLPLEFRDRTLDVSRVQHACHALALDDERTTFQPVLWDESRLDPLPPGVARHTKNEKISQVWFAGVHSNVGGGYPDDSLAHVSLNWIIAEAQICNLKFKPADPNAVKQAEAAQDKDGRLYDSRAGFGGYYRYGPRKLEELCDMQLSDDPNDVVKIALPKIHESVFDRAKTHAHLYAPLVLPRNYEVVTYAGDIIAPDQSPYETRPRAKFRARMQERVWDLVWKRRAIYFLTVFTSLYLATYPFYHRLSKAAEYESSFRMVSDIIRQIERFLPTALTTWTDSYARDPVWFLLIAGILATLLLTTARLAAVMKDRMNVIWRVALHGNVQSPRSNSTSFQILCQMLRPKRVLVHSIWTLLALTGLAFAMLPLIQAHVAIAKPLLQKHRWMLDLEPVPILLALYFLVLALPESWVSSLRRKGWYRSGLQILKLRLVPACFALLFLYFAVGSINHIVFSMEQAAGFVCEPSQRLSSIRLCSPPTLAMCGQNNEPTCQNSKVVPACADGSAVACRSRTAPDSNSKATIYVDAMCGNTPAICGKPCTDDVKDIKRKFDISDICFATGLRLDRAQNYRITISPEGQDRWSVFGGQIETVAGGSYITDPGLQLSQRAKMIFWWPFISSFARPWSTVVLRAAQTGNAEKFLDPDESSTPFALRRNTPLQSSYRPYRDGELFVYVNDVGLAGGASLDRLFKFINTKTKGTVFETALPRVTYHKHFYKDNKGTATIRVLRIPN